MGSGDLQSWDRLGFILSMDDDPDLVANVSGIYPPEKGFFKVFAVDYSDAYPTIPESLIAPGTTLELKIPGGTLMIFPDGEDQGSWTFDEDGGGQLTGNFDAAENFLWEGNNALLPDTGAYFDQDNTLATLIPFHVLNAVFEQALGPWEITAIQTALSFHGENHGGYFEVSINADARPQNAPFRGTFTAEFPSAP